MEGQKSSAVRSTQTTNFLQHCQLFSPLPGETGWDYSVCRCLSICPSVWRWFLTGVALATPVYVIGRKLRTSPHNVGHFVVCQYYRHVNVYRCAGENNPSVMGNILSETSFSISNSLYVVVISTRLLIIFHNSAHVCIFLQVYGPYR